MHPLYKNPEYAQAIKDHDYALNQIQKWNNESYKAWKTIERLEKEYKESGACDSYVEDPAICDDMGQPKGQCVCGYKWFDYAQFGK